MGDSAELTQLKNGKKQRQDSTIEEINPKNVPAKWRKRADICFCV
jgi:hypothetical protein